MNRIEITGRLGNDPELRVVGNGIKTSFRLAHNTMRQDGTKGPTTWIDVEAWDDLAEAVSNWAAKSNYVRVTGRLIQQTWDDKTTGQKRSKHVIRAREIAPGLTDDQNQTA